MNMRLYAVLLVLCAGLAATVWSELTSAGEIGVCPAPETPGAIWAFG